MLKHKKYLILLLGGIFLTMFSPKINAQEAEEVAPAEIVDDGVEEGEYQIEDLSNDVAFEENDFESEFYKGQVVEIIEDQKEIINGVEQDLQVVKVKVLDGPDEGDEVDIRYGDIYTLTEIQKLKEGDKVIISKSRIGGEVEYYIEDKYRITSLIIIFAVFCVVIIAFGRIKGFTSILGLGFTFLVLIKYVIPQILDGGNPLLICFIGSLMILVVSLYLAHGFNKQTSVALLSSFITLLLAFVFGLAFVIYSKLSGTGSDGAFILQSGLDHEVNLRGLLLGGIIIGTLGVLDDITAGQTQVIQQLKEANSKFTTIDLYKRGIKVGKEHVASMVNTLVLAYAGTSLPLLILIVQNKSNMLWVTLNSEFIAEEVVRSLVGSIALIFAVPISTWIAAVLLSRKSKIESKK